MTSVTSEHQWDDESEQEQEEPDDEPDPTEEILVSLEEKIKLQIPGYGTNLTHKFNRTKVKESIVKAYELAGAAKKLRELLQDDNINPILKTLFEEKVQSYEVEKESILSVNPDLLSSMERSLLEFVKYQIIHDVRKVVKIDNNEQLDKWLQYQRQKGNAFLNNNREKLKGDFLEAQDVNIKLLRDRLHVQFDSIRTAKFDEYMEELRIYKKKHGHTNVKRIKENGDSDLLGEFVRRTRREYDILQRNPKQKVPNLTPQRIQQLNDMGFVWRLRSPRPRTTTTTTTTKKDDKLSVTARSSNNNDSPIKKNKKKRKRNDNNDNNNRSIENNNNNTTAMINGNNNDNNNINIDNNINAINNSIAVMNNNNNGMINNNVDMNNMLNNNNTNNIITNFINNNYPPPTDQYHHQQPQIDTNNYYQQQQDVNNNNNNNNNMRRNDQPQQQPPNINNYRPPQPNDYYRGASILDLFR